MLELPLSELPLLEDLVEEELVRLFSDCESVDFFFFFDPTLERERERDLDLDLDLDLTLPRNAELFAQELGGDWEGFLPPL